MTDLLAIADPDARAWRSILAHTGGVNQFFLLKHPDGRVAGQQAAGLSVVALELPSA